MLTFRVLSTRRYLSTRANFPMLRLLDSGASSGSETTVIFSCILARFG